MTLPVPDGKTCPRFTQWDQLNANEGKLNEWSSIEAIDALLGGISQPVPDRLVFPCWSRLQTMRKELTSSWKGCDTVINWLLSTFVARENPLLIGPPGGAKSEIVTRLYALLGLSTPKVDAADRDLIRHSLVEQQDLLRWWDKRVAHERRVPKQFHYLLQRFVQPEELFGPIEIELLRRGILVRVNFGMLTGPGVFAAFLDEIFTASPNLLNVLLTLLNERKYFNWGGMVQGDLIMLAAASNELPGGAAMVDDEFRASYALLDRFAVRLRVDLASATSVVGTQGLMQSDLVQATRIALQRDANRFCCGQPFGKEPRPVTCLSDLLCLGRYLYQGLAGDKPGARPFDEEALGQYDRQFYSLAAFLQRDATRLRDLHVTWTISPRKLKALYKVGLAHALIRSEQFNSSQQLVRPDPQDLLAFTLAWDSLDQQDRLEKLVRANLEL